MAAKMTSDINMIWNQPLVKNVWNSSHLEEVGQHDESLLPDDSFIVSQTRRDVGDVMIHDVGVSNTQITHNHNHVVTHSNFCADLQLPGKHRQVLLDQFIMLQTQFSCTRQTPTEKEKKKKIKGQRKESIEFKVVKVSQTLVKEK